MPKSKPPKESPHETTDAYRRGAKACSVSIPGTLSESIRTDDSWLRTSPISCVGRDKYCLRMADGTQCVMTHRELRFLAGWICRELGTAVDGLEPDLFGTSS